MSEGAAIVLVITLAFAVGAAWGMLFGVHITLRRLEKHE